MMGTMIFLIGATGIAWTLVAILFSRIPGENQKYAAFMFLQAAVYTGGACAVNRPEAVPVMEFLKLAAIFVPSALSSLAGFFAMRKAMTCGYNGIAWCVGQSALICPFLAGVLFFGGRKSFWQFLGVALLISGLILLARVRQTGGTQRSGGHGDPKKFFVWISVSFLLIGAAQALTLLPGSVIDFSESTLKWRVPLTAMCGFCWIFGVRRFYFRELWRGVLLYGTVVTAGNLLFYAALDAAAKMRLSAIAYPACLGLSVILFFLYCGTIRKERLGTEGYGGVLLAGIGIFLQMF